jgi:hypothetical protein
MANLRDDFWVHLSSNVDQSDLFPNNRPDKFTCRLPTQLQFFGERVKVAVWYISIPTFWNVINETNRIFWHRKFTIGTKTLVIPGAIDKHKVNVGRAPPKPKTKQTSEGAKKDQIASNTGSRAALSPIGRGRLDTVTGTPDATTNLVAEKTDDTVDPSAAAPPPSSSSGVAPPPQPPAAETIDLDSSAEGFDDATEGGQNDEPDDDAPSAKRQKRDDNHKWNAKGDIDVRSYVKWINGFIPRNLRANVNITMEVADNVELPVTRSIIINFNIIGDGISIELDKTFADVWKDIGVTNQHIGKKVDTSFKAISLPFVKQKKTISFTITVKHQDTEKEVPDEQYTETTSKMLPIGFFGSTETFLETLQELCPKTNVLTLSPTNHLILTIPNGMDIKFAEELGKLLGFPGGEWIRQNTTISKKVFTLHPVSTFYLYSNLIEPQITSNRFTPLLHEIVPHSSREISYLSDSTPHPVPVPMYKYVNPITLNEISFYIVDQEGRPVSFIAGSGETSIILHFKKEK